MKKKIKGCLVLGLCLLLTYPSLASYANASAIEGPAGANQTMAEKMGVSEEDYARYMDNRLEYSEIEALVHYFNPSISKAWKTYNANALDITRNISDLEVGRKAVSGLAENAKDAGDPESYGMYYSQDMALKKMIQSLNKSKVGLLKEVSISNESLRNSERQMNHAVKSMMVNYLSLRKQVELLRQGIALKEQWIAVSKTSVNAGVAIMQNVIRANSELTKSLADLATLDSNAESIRRTLITMLGWDVNAQPEIVDISVEDFVNQEVVSSIRLDEDIQRAIGNNYSLISLRRSKVSRNYVQMESRQMSEEQMEGNVRNDVNAKYQDLQTAMLDYDAKKVALQAGEQKANAASTQLRLGMISQIRYNESALEFTQAKINKEVSGLNLLLAYLDYVDAIEGSASAE